jgi:hypothetical protein
VLDPEATLREVFAWLEAPWSPRLLEHHLVLGERGAPRKVEGGARTDAPISTERISAWTEEATEENVAYLKSKADGLFEFFGYDPDDPDALAPLTVEGTARVKTLTGAELARRRDAFPELTQLDKPMTPWFGNRMLTPEAIGVATPKSKRAAAKAAAAPPPPPPSTSAKLRKLAGRAARKVRPAPTK